MEWTQYNFKNKKSHPPAPGRYLIYKEKCDKVCFGRWNGSGWSENNHDCSDWRHIDRPQRVLKSWTDEDAHQYYMQTIFSSEPFKLRR